MGRSFLWAMPAMQSNVCCAGMEKGISRNWKIPFSFWLFGFTVRLRRLAPFSLPGIPAL